MKSLILSLLVVMPFSFSMAMGPCKADIETYCKDVEKGGGKIHQCLKDNEAKLSAECKAHRETMSKAMKDVKEACMADVEANCMADGKHMGRGKMRMCMKKNMDKFSDACKEAMKDMKGMKPHHGKGGGSPAPAAPAEAAASAPAAPAADKK